ncbi:MAG: hypothetical protein HOP28_16695 [Gemmatimonadales bacterium]|nr:hypothetical protein [Gemmatimonadales bacterium]
MAARKPSRKSATKKRPAKKRTASRRPGISRIDQPSTRTHGWFVRVGYHVRKDGVSAPRHTKFFGDAGHGGKTKALRMAEKFVASLAKVLKKKKK